MPKQGIIAILFLFSFPLFGQVTFKATPSKNIVGVNETFQLYYKLENATGQNFQPPSFEDFNVLGGPNQSSNMQFINGNMSRSITYSYYLQPKRNGQFTIKGAKITAGGKTLTSNNLTITVGSPDGKKGNQPKTIQEQIAERIFLRIIIDKNEAYLGEQITVTYKIMYHDLNFVSPQLITNPAFTGFWAQEIKTGNNNNSGDESYKGKRWRTLVVKKVALFPQRSGKLTIDPMELQVYVRVQTQQQRGKFFDDFFNMGSYQNIPYKFGTKQRIINIKPLPTKGRPDHFTGAVGQYKLKTEIDKTETEVDDPITLKMILSGKGNVRMINAPKIVLPKDFEVFDPKVKQNVSQKSNVVSGSKQYDYLIIPRRPGEFKLAATKLSFFDPKQEKYVTLRTPEYTFKVTGEASTESSKVFSGVTKEEVELLGEDIRFIYTDNSDFRKKGDYLLNSLSFVGYYASPFLLFIILFFVKRIKEKSDGDLVAIKRKKAGKVAAKHLSKAKGLLQQKDKKGFYEEVSKAIWGFLGDKLNIQHADLSKDKVESIFKQQEIYVPLITKTFSIIDDCQMALFAPSDSSSMETTYNEAIEVINDLEEVLS